MENTIAGFLEYFESTFSKYGISLEKISIEDKITGPRKLYSSTLNEVKDGKIAFYFIESSQERESVWFDISVDNFELLHQSNGNEKPYDKVFLVLLIDSKPFLGTYIIDTRALNYKLTLNGRSKTSILEWYLPEIDFDLKARKWRCDVHFDQSNKYYFTVGSAKSGNTVPIKKDNFDFLEARVKSLYEVGSKESEEVSAGNIYAQIIDDLEAGTLKVGASAKKVFLNIDQDPALFKKVLQYINSDESGFRTIYGAKILRPLEEGDKDRLGKQRYYKEPLPKHNYLLSNHWFLGYDDIHLKKMLTDLELV
ncbi:hypothetical protein ACSX1A_04035 [Pontibacter sp. MBLB2868]|uniref:hypothetical protein n=1 Tax=Pontibacter sp. MBLB2868 TaxID=3451555 RepID=UPI003F74B0DB